MINLIFDLNNIVHRSLFAVSGYGSNAYSFDSQSEIDQLMRKMAIDFAHIIRLIKPSRVILAKDDSSWRKDIEIDENEGYKGNRTKSSFINWDNVYRVLDEFIEITEAYGMIPTSIPKAEADDIITLWAHELLYNQNQHVIIVSGDEDLRQLVRTHVYDVDKQKYAFCTVFNPFMQGKNASRKLFIPSLFENWIATADAADFMNIGASINVDKEDFKKIIAGEKTKVECIDGPMIGLRKMFCGDDGDNIPAIYTWLNDKGTQVRITNSKFEKIYNLVQEHENEILDHNIILERKDQVLDAIRKVIKDPKLNLNIEALIERQIKLAILDPKVFPQSIIDKFETTKDELLQRPRVNYSSINMHNILEGTRYVSERKRDNEASIFKEIDRISRKSLF